MGVTENPVLPHCDVSEENVDASSALDCSGISRRVCICMRKQSLQVNVEAAKLALFVRGDKTHQQKPSAPD
jgi:hypothetical protein